MDRLERIRHNEHLLREANRRIKRHAVELREQGMAKEREQVEFLCACGQAHCDSTVSLTVSQYEGAHRADGTQFILVRGHVTAAIESVVEDHGDWVVVEKLPERQL